MLLLPGALPGPLGVRAAMEDDGRRLRPPGLSSPPCTCAGCSPNCAQNKSLLDALLLLGACPGHAVGGALFCGTPLALIHSLPPRLLGMQDVNKEPGAEDMFKKIGEAYEVGQHAER